MIQEVEEPIEIVESKVKKVVEELGGFFWTETPYVEMEEAGTPSHNTYNNHLEALQAIAFPDMKAPQVEPPLFECDRHP